MNSIHEVVLTTIYSRMRADRAQLEHEESAATIARLQGKISGYNLLIDQMKEHIPFLSFVDNEDEEINPHDMEDRDLVMLSMDLITDKAYWNPIEKFMKYEVAKDKHYLYYTASKPRSLGVTHGKRDGMLTFKGIYAAIKQEIESRREEEPLFKEELSDDKIDLNQFDFDNDIDPAEVPELFDDDTAEEKPAPAENVVEGDFAGDPEDAAEETAEGEAEETYEPEHDLIEDEPALEDDRPPYEIEQEASGLDEEEQEGFNGEIL